MKVCIIEGVFLYKNIKCFYIFLKVGFLIKPYMVHFLESSYKFILVLRIMVFVQDITSIETLLLFDLLSTGLCNSRKKPYRFRYRLPGRSKG